MYKRKDGTTVFKKGRYKVLEIWKRPHGSYACLILNKGYAVAGNGYFGTPFKTIAKAKAWGIKKAKELGIL